VYVLNQYFVDSNSRSCGISVYRPTTSNDTNTEQGMTVLGN